MYIYICVLIVITRKTSAGKARRFRCAGSPAAWQPPTCLIIIKDNNNNNNNDNDNNI